MDKNIQGHRSQHYIQGELPVAWTKIKPIDDAYDDYLWMERSLPVVTFRAVFGDEELRVPCSQERALDFPDAINGFVYEPLGFVSTDAPANLTFHEDPFRNICESYSIRGRAPCLVNGFIFDMQGQWRETSVVQGLVRVSRGWEDAFGYHMGVCLPNILRIEDVDVDEVLSIMGRARKPFRSVREATQLAYPEAPHPTDFDDDVTWRAN